MKRRRVEKVWSEMARLQSAISALHYPQYAPEIVAERYEVEAVVEEREAA